MPPNKGEQKTVPHVLPDVQDHDIQSYSERT